MAKLNRIIQKIFAKDATATQLTKIGSLAAGLPEYTTDLEAAQELENYEQGFHGICLGNNSPAIEDMNSLMKLVTYQLAYLMQQGIAEWDSATEYHEGSIVSVDGVAYVSLSDDNLGNAVTDINHWKIHGNHFDANIVNGRVTPIAPTTESVFTRSATLSMGGVWLNEVIPTIDGRFLLICDDTAGHFKIRDFNPKKIGTVSAGTVTGVTYGKPQCIAESPDEKFVAVGIDVSPYVLFYERVKDSEFALLNQPASIPAAHASNFVDKVAFSPDSKLAAFSGNQNCKLVIYRRDGLSWVKVADPAVMPNDYTRDVSFSPDGNFLTIVSSAIPTALYIYKITYDASGLPVFTLVPNTVTWVVSNGVGIKWHPDSSCIIATDATPRVFTIDSNGELTEVVQTGFINLLHLNPCFSPDGKSIYFWGSNSAPEVSFGGIVVYRFNTVTKQASLLQQFADDISPVFDYYYLSISSNNKYLVVKRYDQGPGHDNIDIFENPNSVDVYNKTPQIKYKIGS